VLLDEPDNDIRAAILEKNVISAGNLPSSVRISILMPVYNTPSEVLEDAIESVLVQSYGDWELCIADDCSTSETTLEILEKFRGIDPRLKITRTPRNLHIAEATNCAAEFATGDFVAFLDHDDMLQPEALELLVSAMRKNPEADFFYTDEDKLDFDGTLTEPYLKPDWSPEHLTSVMYVLHFMAVRKRLFLQLGGLRDYYSGAQDYDLALRATAKARKVVHVPHVLYHWRKIEGSAAAVVDAKPQALLAAFRCLEDFVKTQDSRAEVVDGKFTGSFRVKWPVDRSRPVTLLILTHSTRKVVPERGEILLVEHAVNSIVEQSTFRNFKIVILDDGLMPRDAHRRLAKAGIRIENYAMTPPFNFAQKMNRALDLVETEDVVLLNDDIEVIAPDWLEALLAFSRRAEIGAVGARLLYPNGRVQHQGMVLGVNGATTHIFNNMDRNDIGYCGFTHVIRNYSAVTGAVLATRMSIVREIGGFDPKLAVDYNDTDFCLRIGAAGYRIVYTPFAELHHFEGSSLPRTSANAAEQEYFVARWGKLIDADPFYNPRLPKDRVDCGVTEW
jgi:GT2 family glycosyltransferase